MELMAKGPRRDATCANHGRRVSLVPFLCWMLLLASCSAGVPSEEGDGSVDAAQEVAPISSASSSPATTTASLSSTTASPVGAATVGSSTVSIWCRDGEDNPCWVLDEGETLKAFWSAEADPITDRITSRVWTESGSGNHVLFMGCVDSSPGWVGFNSSDPLFYHFDDGDGAPDPAVVVWRVDGGEVQQGPWVITEGENSNAIYLVPGLDPALLDWAEARSFIDQIWDAETLALRATMPNGDSVTAVFDLRGFFATPLSGEGGNLENCDVPSTPASQDDPVEDTQLIPEVVAAGGTHSCLTRSDGTVLCWGGNGAGQADPPDGTFTALTAGYSHTCGLRPGGAVECWGGSSAGQTEAPGGVFSELDAGDIHTCGLRQDRTIQCWGSNWGGQTDAPPGEFALVGSGSGFSCGLRQDGTIQCWGNDWMGSNEPPTGEFVALATGGYHSCALRQNGTVECWGDNENGQAVPPPGQFVEISAGGEHIGEGLFTGHSCGIRVDRTVQCWGDMTNPPASERFDAIVSGGSHVCGRTTQGKAICWGSNFFGQTVAPGTQFMSVSAGPGTCGIQTNGNVSCWGSNIWGERPAGPLLEVAAGGRPGWAHTCGLETDRTISCWGNNPYRQSEAPNGQFFAIDTGINHSCGLQINRTIRCWGSDLYGQATPLEGTYTAVSTGGWHTCALTTDQTVVCWGHNQTNTDASRMDIVSGTLPEGWATRCQIGSYGHHMECWGNNQFGQSSPPAGTYTAVSAGGWHTCALTTEGTIQCWGDSTSGQSSPPAGTYTAVSAGGWHTCALTTEGTIQCWGDDTSGQSSPPAGTYTAVSAGYGHSCGLRTDGSIDCWGFDSLVTTPR